MAARLWRYIEFGFLINQNLRTGNVGHPSSPKKWSVQPNWDTRTSTPTSSFGIV